MLAAAAAGMAVIALEGASSAGTEPGDELLVRVGDPPLAVVVEDLSGEPGGAAVPLRVTSDEPDRLVDSLSGELRAALPLGPLRRLVASMSAVSVSVERACPPPALLACGPGLEVAARLARSSPGAVSRQVGEIARAGLRRAGLRDLRVDSSADGAGRVRAGGEPVDLAVWRVDGAALRVAAGGLDLGAASLAPPPTGSAPASAAGPHTRIRIDPSSLAALLPAGTARLR